MRKTIIGPGFEYLAAVDPKDAGIERLKAENNSLRLDVVEYRRLITELCDALVYWRASNDDTEDELIQRAWTLNPL